MGELDQLLAEANRSLPPTQRFVLVEDGSHVRVVWVKFAGGWTIEGDLLIETQVACKCTATKAGTVVTLHPNNVIDALRQGLAQLSPGRRSP